MRSLGLLAIGLAGGVVLLLHLITQPTAQRHQRLDAELTLQQWLSELAGELAESSHRKLFPNRAELDRKTGELTIYWVETGTARFYRQSRDGRGNTDLVVLNPGLPLRSLSFERVDTDRVRIRLQAVDPTLHGQRDVRVEL